MSMSRGIPFTPPSPPNPQPPSDKPSLPPRLPPPPQSAHPKTPESAPPASSHEGSTGASETTLTPQAPAAAGAGRPSGVPVIIERAREVRRTWPPPSPREPSMWSSLSMGLSSQSLSVVRGGGVLDHEAGREAGDLGGETGHSFLSPATTTSKTSLRSTVEDEERPCRPMVGRCGAAPGGRPLMPHAVWFRALVLAFFSWTGQISTVESLEGGSLTDSGPGMDPNG